MRWFNIHDIWTCFVLLMVILWIEIYITNIIETGGRQNGWGGRWLELEGQRECGQRLDSHFLVMGGIWWSENYVLGLRWKYVLQHTVSGGIMCQNIHSEQKNLMIFPTGKNCCVKKTTVDLINSWWECSATIKKPCLAQMVSHEKNYIKNKYVMNIFKKH